MKSILIPMCWQAGLPLTNSSKWRPQYASHRLHLMSTIGTPVLAAPDGSSEHPTQGACVCIIVITREIFLPLDLAVNTLLFMTGRNASQAVLAMATIVAVPDWGFWGP